MSTHLVHELEAIPLFQTFTVEEKKVLAHIAIKLYIHNDPPGTFTLNLKLENDDLIASKLLTMAEIIAGAGFNANEYHYGYLLFDFDTFINIYPEVNYKIELVSTGYTMTADSLMGWIQPHENKLNENTTGYGFKLYGPTRGGAMRVIDFFDGQSSSTVPTYEALNVSTTGYFYIGDESTDGSWRMSVDAGIFKHEKKIAGV